MNVSELPTRAIIGAARSNATSAHQVAQQMADAAPATIDRLMLELAATMCASACRQLAKAEEIIQDVQHTPATPDRQEAAP